MNYISQTESWLDNIVLDSELQVPGYEFFRKDWTFGRGGDILLYYKINLACNRRVDLECNSSHNNKFFVCEFSGSNKKFMY